MPRRTPTELQLHHEAQARKHAFAARVAASPALKLAIKLREILPAGDHPRHDALIKALDAYIGEVP